MILLADPDCQYRNLPIGVVVFTGLSVFLRFKGSHSKHRSLPLKVKLSSMDPLGCLLFVGSACSVLLALQWGGQSKPWKSADVLGCLIGGVILAIFFIFWQWKKQEEALITPRVFAQRSVWTAAMTLFFIGAQAYAVGHFLTLRTRSSITDKRASRFHSSSLSGSRASGEPARSRLVFISLHAWSRSL